MSDSDVTRILHAAAAGDAHAASQLLPLVYAELRKLAAQRLSQEKPGQTLQATALVHEAYLRLVDVGAARAQHWDGRGHFFGAAAEAMRRILIERARRKAAAKHGGGMRRVDLDRLPLDEPAAIAADGGGGEDDAAVEWAQRLLALDGALAELEAHDPRAASLVKLRYFAGLGHGEAAEVLGIGRRTADGLWALAKAWLYQRLSTR